MRRVYGLPQADLRFYLRAETAPWAHPHRFGSSFKGRTSDSHRRLRVFVAVACESHPGCASSCLRGACPLCCACKVALARVPFDLPLVYFTARAVSVRLISFASACGVCPLISFASSCLRCDCPPLCRNTCRTVPTPEPKCRKRKEEKGAHVGYIHRDFMTVH